MVVCFLFSDYDFQIFCNNQTTSFCSLIVQLDPSFKSKVWIKANSKKTFDHLPKTFDRVLGQVGGSYLIGISKDEVLSFHPIPNTHSPNPHTILNQIPQGGGNQNLSSIKSQGFNP